MEAGKTGEEAEEIIPFNEHHELANKPTVLQKAKNLTKEIIKSGKRVVKNEPLKVPQTMADERWAICNNCPKFNDGQCSICGCSLRNKIWWASGTCPLDKWGIMPVTPKSISSSMISIIIPNRDEEYLERTIEDIKKNTTGSYEIIVIDDPVIPDKPAKGIQRCYNEGAVRAKGELLFFVDGHCSFSKGWSQLMRDGYQSQSILCTVLSGLDVGEWKKGPNLFGEGYFNENNKIVNRVIKNNGKGVIGVQAFSGCGWMISREYFWYLNGCDEGLGAHGHVGIEWSAKAWMYGGRVQMHRGVIIGHYFRSRFPYPAPRGVHQGSLKLKSDLENLTGSYQHALYTFNWVLGKKYGSN